MKNPAPVRWIATHLLKPHSTVLHIYTIYINQCDAKWKRWIERISIYLTEDVGDLRDVELWLSDRVAVMD